MADVFDLEVERDIHNLLYCAELEHQLTGVLFTVDFLVHAEVGRQADGNRRGFPFETLLHFVEGDFEVNVVYLRPGQFALVRKGGESFGELGPLVA